MRLRARGPGRPPAGTLLFPWREPLPCDLGPVFRGMEGRQWGVGMDRQSE
jgi:hypothetical protein